MMRYCYWVDCNSSFRDSTLCFLLGFPTISLLWADGHLGTLSRGGCIGFHRIGGGGGGGGGWGDDRGAADGTVEV